MKKYIFSLLIVVTMCSMVRGQDLPAPKPEPVMIQEGEPGPNDFVLLEREPAPLNIRELAGRIGYPPEAKEQNIQGKVIVRVYVSKAGEYVKHMVVKDPHPLLTNAVTAQLRHLRFSPGIQKGKPIDVWVTIPFDFKLQEDDLIPGKTVFYDLESALSAPDPDQVLELYLNGKGLTHFPTEVSKFRNLQKLELGDNQLTVVPGAVEDLKHLRFLGLSMNKFTSLPQFIWSLPEIRGVNVSQNLFPKDYQKKLEKEHGGLLFPKNEKGRVMW